MTKEREALKIALEALEEIAWSNSTDWQRDRAKVVIPAIKEVLEQPPEERNFCPRCGKRAGKNAWDVHTCSLPEQEPSRECTTEAEKMAFAFGWWKALEAQRLALSKQEPVAWGVDWGEVGGIPCVSIIKRLPDGGIEVLAVEYAPCSYTTQPNQTWVGLTDDEREELMDTYDVASTDYARAIEAKLKEKNGFAKDKNK